ncbi:hypothetical protein V2J09_009270 [Rumex salicifolius]
MELSTEQNPQPCSTNPSNEDEMAPDHQSPASPLANTNGGAEPENKFSAEEVRGVLQVIASTGKFWNDWDELKSMLSFQLKQVLSEYPEAKMGDTLGEMYQDLVKRLDGALHNFPEGPPFTLQRLCEILLDARDIYPVLSKVALALEKLVGDKNTSDHNMLSVTDFDGEKNLLVTTTLSKCTDPAPLFVVEHQADTPNDVEGNTKPHLDSMENGMLPPVEDKDEVMTEVEEVEVEDDMTVDTENFGGNVSSSENISQPTNDS